MRMRVLTFKIGRRALDADRRGANVLAFRARSRPMRLRVFALVRHRPARGERTSGLPSAIRHTSSRRARRRQRPRSPDQLSRRQRGARRTRHRASPCLRGFVRSPAPSAPPIRPSSGSPMEAARGVFARACCNVAANSKKTRARRRARARPRASPATLGATCELGELRRPEGRGQNNPGCGWGGEGIWRSPDHRPVFYFSRPDFGNLRCIAAETAEP